MRVVRPRRSRVVDAVFPRKYRDCREAAATFTYERGKKYAFYLESFKRERGQLTGRLAGWEPEPLEIAQEAVGSPQGEPPPF